MAEKKTSKHQEMRGMFREMIPEEAREHLKAARASMRDSADALFPPGYLENRREARKHVLRAARSFIDHALDRMEGETKA